MPVIAPQRETSPQYRAGLFDGEGSITGIHVYGKRYVPILSMGNTDLALLGAMQTAYGGHICRQRKLAGRKQSWTWTLRCAPKVRAAIVDMLPFLIGKAERARLMLVLLTTYRCIAGRNKIPDDMAIRRAMCVTELHDLNRRGAA